MRFTLTIELLPMLSFENDSWQHKSIKKLVNYSFFLNTTHCKSNHCPRFREKSSLIQNRLGRLFLHIRRVAIFPENSFHQYPQVGPDVLPQRSVNGDILSDGVHQLSGDGLEGDITQDLHRTVIDLKGVIEGQFVFG